LVEAAEVFQAGSEDDKAHHDFHPRHPTAAPRHAFEVGRKQGEEEEGQCEPAGEADHPDERTRLAAGYRSCEQGSDEGSDAGEGGEREGQAHEEAAEESALVRGLIEAGENRGGDGDFEGAEQAEVEGDEEYRDEGVDPGIGAEGDNTERPKDGGGGEAETGEENDDSEAEDKGLHDAVAASAGLPVEEVGHRDGNH